MPWNLIGHQWAVQHLQRDLARGRLRHAYLFAGVPGIGKRTLALQFAQAVHCLNPPGPCGQCRPCRLIAKGGHPDALVIHSEQMPRKSRSGEDSQTRSIKIEQMRELEQLIALSPYESHHRTPLILRFHEATAAAQNALLKTLEEPPAQVVLLLTTDSPDLLLPTIVSRCQVLLMRPLPVASVESALLERGAPPAQAALLAHLSGGRIGWALQAATDQGVLAERQAQLEEMLALLAAPPRDRRQYAEVLGKRGRLAVAATLELWQTWWRDVLLAASRAQAPLANVDYGERIQHLAERLEPARVHTFLQALRATGHALERNGNARLALEVLMFDFPGAPG
jgi:DNA polymerase-3 subunit delta'